MKKVIFSFLVLLLGIGLAAGNVTATSYDPSNQDGWSLQGGPKMMVTPVTPMLWNHGNMGDALYGEIYRAVSMADITDPLAPDVNFVTYFSVQNTSSKWVAAHIRLRSGRYSIEVYDFPILLSPRDVFWMQFESEKTQAGFKIKLFSNDENTLTHSGLDVTAWSQGIYLKTLLIDQFEYLVESMDWDEEDILMETTQGHIEVFGLFAFDWPSISLPPGQNFKTIMKKFYDKTKTLAAQNCTDFYENGVQNEPTVSILEDWGLITAQDVGNYLMGQVHVGDFATGHYMGYAMKAIQNFRAACGTLGIAECGAGGDCVAYRAEIPDLPFHRDDVLRGWLSAPGVIVYNAYGADYPYTEPDWATSWGPTWNDGDDYINKMHLPRCETTLHNLFESDYRILASQSWSLDEVDDAIVKQQVWAPFFNKGFSGETYTLAAVSFPTKYLHFFFNAESGLKDWLGVGLVGPDQETTNAWPIASSQAQNVRAYLDVEKFQNFRPINIGFGLWDLKEIPCSVSDSPYPIIQLPWEVTLVPIGVYSQEALADFCFLIHAPKVQGNCLATTFKAGHFTMQGFEISGGDPRNQNYCDAGGPQSQYFPMRENFYGTQQPDPDYNLHSMLSQLYDNGYPDIIPASIQMMDFEFTGGPHSRMFDPAWNNPPIVGFDPCDLDYDVKCNQSAE